MDISCKKLIGCSLQCLLLQSKTSYGTLDFLNTYSHLKMTRKKINNTLTEKIKIKVKSKIE